VSLLSGKAMAVAKLFSATVCEVDLEIRFDMPPRYLPKGMRGMLPKGQNPPKALAQYAL
jgi:hypothetical protein